MHIIHRAILCFFSAFIASAAMSDSNSPFLWSGNIIGDEIEVVVDVPDKYYLDSNMTSVKLEDSLSVQIKAETSPSPVDSKDDSGLDHKIYTPGKHSWRFKASGTPPYTATAQFQGCSKDPYVCYPPTKTEIKLGDATAVAAAPGSQADDIQTLAPSVQTAPARKSVRNPGLLGNLLEKGGLWLFLAAFVGGLLSTLTPCVLPLIPVTLAILGAGKDAGRAKALQRSALYVIGIMLTFTSLAAIAAFSGSTFGTLILGNRLIIILFSVIFCALGLSMLGLFELQLPSSIQEKFGRLGGNSPTGAFLMGIAAGFIAVPCTGPVLAALLGIVAVSGNPILGTVLLATYAAGFGAPFIFIGAGAVKMPRSGPYMDAVKSVLGVAILTVAFFAIFVAFPAAKYELGQLFPPSTMVPVSLVICGFMLGAVHSDGHSSRKSIRLMKYLGAFLVAFGIFWSVDAPSHASTAEKIQWRYSFNDGTKSARDRNMPAIVDFTAEWCPACKEMDSLTFSDPIVVKEISAKWLPVKVEATVNTPEIEEIMRKYQVSGLPTIILFGPDGKILSRSTGFVSPEELLKMLDSN